MLDCIATLFQGPIWCCKHREKTVLKRDLGGVKYVVASWGPGLNFAGGDGCERVKSGELDLHSLPHKLQL